MRARFGGFELDDEARTFRTRSGEVTLQPRLFDLLAYLIRNRARVVSKVELVDSVWEGAFVTDSAVQRAISVLRSILREGEADDAIRTYPRQGYRFCREVELEDGPGRESPSENSLPTATGDSPVAPELELAREAFAQRKWQDAADHFHKADAGPGLPGADLERWGEAVESAGRLAEAVVPLERAIAAWSASGARVDAARCALRLANIQLERRELAVAKGWLRRAARFLSASEPSHESALLIWLNARAALFAGKLEETLALSDKAYELACSIGDSDVEALSLLYRGLAQLSLGRVHPGVELLDEAAAAVMAENLSAWTGGIIHCGVIWSCLNRGDWRRAAEWSGQFTRWCATQGIRGYPGLCRLHHAEVLNLQGRVIDAEAEVQTALPQLAESVPDSEGDGYRVLGDIRLGRGDLDGAEEAYRRSHQLGWDPNPGYALVQAARGRVHAGLRALEGALTSSEWSVRQRRAFVLSHLAILAVQAGEMPRAREALAELDQHPEWSDTLAAEAVVAQARGEVALAEKDPESAVMHFRRSIQGWREVSSPFRMAAARLRLACALAAGGDLEGAELELTAAEAAYSQRGLERLAEGCEEMRRQLELRRQP